MAGDWIKVRKDLLTSPKIVRMASILKCDRLRVVGGLLSVWSVFDTHSLDGQLDGYTLAALDDVVAWPGFAAALCKISWLELGDGLLRVPRFDEHMSKAAKRRAEDAERKRGERDLIAGQIADKKRTREEKSITPIRAREPRSRKRSTATPLPENFVVSERVTRWAAEKGYDRLPEYLECFIRKVKAKGYTYVDWDEALMNCIADDWGKLRQARPGRSEAGNPDWWSSPEGIAQKSREVGISARPGESNDNFKQRIFDRLRAQSATPKARAH